MTVAKKKMVKKDLQKAEKEFLAPINMPAGEHNLRYAYCLWYSRRSLGKQASAHMIRIEADRAFCLCRTVMSLVQSPSKAVTPTES